MGEKFLQTRASRKRFVVWTLMSIILLVVAFIGVIGLWDGAIFGSHPLSSQYWWVNVAQVFVMCIIILCGMVLAVALVAYGLYFFTGAPEYEYTLRAYVGWYDTFCLKLMAGGRKLVEHILAPTGNAITWPFRKISTGVRKWINSGL